MNAQKKVLEQSRWSLADLYPSGGSNEMEAAVKDLEARVADFEKCRENLTDKSAQPISWLSSRIWKRSPS